MEQPVNEEPKQPDSPDGAKRLSKSEAPIKRDTEIIYILTNPTMPDLVKIGKATDLKARVRSLSSHGGVPVPFEVHYASVVAISKRVEKRLHKAFKDHRVNPKREFFRINPEQVISAIEIAEGEEITLDNGYVEDPEEQQSLNKEKRRANFSFPSVEITAGEELQFVLDKNIKATVVNDRDVEFEGKVTSLTRAALEILKRDYNKDWVTVRGPDYWIYDSETLSARRTRLESGD